LLPNSSNIPKSLAYVERRRGQWDRSESYFNEAERLDPRNPTLAHAQSDFLWVSRVRFPEALRKADPDFLTSHPTTRRLSHFKANVAQARATCRVLGAPRSAPTRTRDDNQVLEYKLYQAILERQPGSVIPQLKEILEPRLILRLGYINGELRFYLGWAQEVAGEHAAARRLGDSAQRTGIFLKEQPENSIL